MESTLYVFSFQMVYFLVQPCFLKGPTRGKMAMVQKILGEKRYLQNKQKGKRKKHFLVVGASAHRRTIGRRVRAFASMKALGKKQNKTNVRRYDIRKPNARRIECKRG